ncbi:hypothetical protein [Chitinophaga qingshengii]|uniref:Uncharacterized protein n=1 Tax=Chitinophaga qingshengii TaxID=1569794 RepID=A0ABR7TGY2_9BACT|nr:hypothetical protein [Chitinophaga qingshengii]MBC9929178.1 hypothetical protein [Chitinophaga qingshengii]
MGPWVFQCAQCGAKNYLPVSAMLQPEIRCRGCGQSTSNPPERQERVRKLLAEDRWYADFLDLIFAMEEELGIEYEDADFPEPFVTWRELLMVTLRRGGTSLTEVMVITCMTRHADITVKDIRDKMDEPISR